MYHYVRPYAKRLSLKHNVLDFDLFLTQLEVIRKNFQFITSKEIARCGNDSLDEQDSIWLTFDDGYKDCIDYVLPGLLRFDARATFYLPTEAIFGRKLLDANKAHILLSSSQTPRQIVNICSDVFEELRIAEFVNESFSDLFLRYGIANVYRHNDSETVFLKKLFQRILPTDLRKQLLSKVFTQVVHRPESSWVDELYLTPDDVRHLHESGMEIGSHSHSHSWLEDLSFDQQTTDLNESFRVLEAEVGVVDYKTMCYPYGSYNADTLNILSDLSVSTAVVDNGYELAVVDSLNERHLELGRIDIMFFEQFIRDEFVRAK